MEVGTRVGEAHPPHRAGTVIKTWAGGTGSSPVMVRLDDGTEAYYLPRQLTELSSLSDPGNAYFRQVRGGG